MNRVERAAKEYNVLINSVETKVTSNTDEILEVMVDGEILEQDDSFVYLWSRTTNDAACGDEVKLRTAMGMTVMVTHWSS